MISSSTPLKNIPSETQHIRMEEKDELSCLKQ